MDEKSKQNYLFVYQQECLRLGTHPLPIFSKINDKNLNLRGYVLSEGICEAFSKAAQMCPDLLQTVHFGDNQLTDKKLGLLMEGVNCFTHLRKIVIKNNEMLENVMTNLDQIVRRPFPNNLDELQIIKVKTSPLIISRLINTLKDLCLLKKVTIVGCQLSDSHLPGVL